MAAVVRFSQKPQVWRRSTEHLLDLPDDGKAGGDGADGGVGEDRSDTSSCDVLRHLASSDSDSEGSDSAEYDTDLELDRNPVPCRKELASKADTDDVVLAERYIRARALAKPPIYPQRRMSEGLAKGTVNLRLRSLGSTPVLPLSVALQDNLRVERLSLEDADIGVEGTLQLCRALVDNITVTYLNLSGNNMGTEGAKYVSYLVTKNKLIKTLILANNKLDDHAAPFLANAVAVTTTLELLDLSLNNLAETSGRLFGAALLENHGLRTLKLHWNHIRGKGAVAIGQSLKVNDTLHVLDVSWNGLGYEGCLALSSSLRDNASLLELNLTNNRVDWRCATLLARGLRENTTLQILRVGRNPLTTTGCMDLVEALSQEDCAVSLLDLSGVPITAETEMLAKMMGNVRDFKLLHGGVVYSPDVIGLRRERQLDPMEHVMHYLKATMLRPLELLRDFDKNVSFKVTEQEFVDRMIKAGVPMHKFEIRELAKAIVDKGGDGKIDYAKFVESIGDQILRDRMRKWQDRMQKKKVNTYHRKILGSGLPSIDENVGRSALSGRNTSDLTFLSTTPSSRARDSAGGYSVARDTLGRDSMGRDNLGRDSLDRDSRGNALYRSASVPCVPNVLERILGKEASTEPEPPRPALSSNKSKFSMSAPLSNVEKKTRKKKKGKRSKKRGKAK